MFACVYSPGYAEPLRPPDPALPAHPARPASALAVVAQQFSPRYETRGDLVVIDVRGLDRLFGNARTIAEELRREAGDRGVRASVAIAGTQTASMVLALARPGVFVIEPGEESAAIARVPLDCLVKIDNAASAAIAVLTHWGLRSLGDLAALPADALSARMGPQGLMWHAIARGADVRPLVPDVDTERFEASLDLEWPIEGLEPLSFVLTRLLEPLSLRLEQRDRGVAVLHVQLRLVTKEMYERRLELPTPMRDVKTLRTLALLDLESQTLFTAGATAPRTSREEQVGIDRVTIVIEPTLGRVWQHTLFARPHPTPEQLSTLLARLGAAMGQDRIGVPVLLDTYRPGAFEMAPFAAEHDDHRGRTRTGGIGRIDGTGRMVENAQSLCPPHPALPAPPACPATALRRCRQPIPAVVAVSESGAPVRVITHRRGFAGGAVLRATGPWKTSGDWWLTRDHEAGQAGRAGQAGWERDEWDVALSDGASYRVFLDRASGGWFVDAILD